ncbi:PEP-CTERM sorting domain-containing protein [Pseudorhodoferax sp.]|uniref:PEP-CTERM sorting domain-containing protein n=1 Tax=Pseudorhodoferax sp. TaxID=1993553 RepID=UPI002DD66BFD|nr:PEP-CTERM sorting domain-containing protein [Pseudorhodoferax sp.]
MIHRPRAALLLTSLLMGAASSAFAAPTVAGFEDLPLPPATDGQTGLYYANGNSATYQGITWDSRFRVVGDEYRVDTATPGPLYGVPNSGRYFVTNEGDGGLNDGLLITTTQVLTGAWFGRNEYYGFGAGADQVTIHALAGTTVLDSVVFDLPELRAAEPELLSFVDTSRFRSLSGITGYRIDRRELGQQSGNWVADDFTFVTITAVPEPASSTLLLGGLGLLGAAVRRRRAAGAGAAHPPG